MQKRNLIAILPTAAMLTLVGCGGDSAVVSNLKEQAFPIDATLTYEQALDRRAVCASTSWSVSEDNRGREVVRYQCQVKGLEAFNEDFIARRGQNAEDLELVSGAEHSIEWFHNDGEYSVSNTMIYLYADSGNDEVVELNEYASFHAALDDSASDLMGLLVVIENHRNPWGW